MTRQFRDAGGSRGSLPPAATCLLAVVVCAVTYGCGGAIGRTSACDRLVYQEGGPTRAEYLPCAGEMLDALDEVRAHLGPGLEGNRGELGKARSALVKARRLMVKAGDRKLLDRWSDAVLTDMNVDMHNAYYGYEATVTPMGMAPMTKEVAEAVREDNGRDFRNASRSLDSARRTYDGLR